MNSTGGAYIISQPESLRKGPRHRLSAALASRLRRCSSMSAQPFSDSEESVHITACRGSRWTIFSVLVVTVKRSPPGRDRDVPVAPAERLARAANFVTL